jgi:HSP20 family protein
MSLIRWSPFFDPFEAFDGMPNLPMRRDNGLVPAVDVYDRADAVVIETALPGVDPKKVELNIENGVLTISGSSERKTEVDEKDYYRKEIRSGSFMRQVALPASISESEAKASFVNGILKIEVPKKEVEKPKKIAVKIENNEDSTAR